MNPSLKSLLYENRIPTGSKGVISTHTRIGLKNKTNKNEWEIYPCNLHIEDIDKFYEIYADKVFVNNQSEYLTEAQNKTGLSPVLIDLDFRYNGEVNERMHNSGLVQDIVELYAETIQKIFNVSNKRIEAYVFEKPKINRMYAKSKNIVKDGIHIVILMCIDHQAQLYLRSEVLKIIHEQILSALPLINKPHDVLDECVSKGEVNWQLFGSKKPENDAYEISHHYDIMFGDDDFDLDDITEINLKDKLKNIPFAVEFLKKISAKNTEHFSPTIKEEHVEFYEKIVNQTNIKRKRKKNKKLPQKNNADILHLEFGMETNMKLIIDSIESASILDQYIENYIMNCSSTESGIDVVNENIKEVHEYTMLLTEDYYNNYPEWIKIGWCLHNTHFKCILSWIKFSSKWDGFDWTTGVSECWDRWNTMREIGYSDRTIRYFAFRVDSEEANKIKQKTLSCLIKQTLNTSFEKNIQGFKVDPRETDLARFAWHMFKHNYRCASIKGNIWYEFKDHRWQKNECGNGLRKKLSTEMSKLYVNRCNSMMAEIREDNNMTEKQTEALIAEGNIYNCIALKLKVTGYKDNVLKECKEVFYDKNFEEKLNNEKTKTLLCFNNGIYDFENREFRNGEPEDYISKCTGTDYIEINRSNATHNNLIHGCNDFMEKLFPNNELRRYMWDHLSGCLLGTTHEQTFNIYNGAQGSNGKSKLREFMSIILGQSENGGYAGTVPITLITQKRKQLGGTSSEVAQLNGLRYACMDEPSEGDKINEGIMKQITGGDPLQARELYKESFTFIPQFKLVCCTNHLPEIKSTDGGTWRRIRIVEFESTFKETIEEVSDEPEDYEFLGDPALSKKLILWVPIMTSLLIENACKKKLWENKIEKCDMVNKASRAFQEKSDYLSVFSKEKIIKGEKRDKISKTHIQEVFKQWYNNMYPGEKLPSIQKLHDYLDNELGKYRRQGWHGFKIKYDNYASDSDIEEE
jgi:P4 family phage/plasmid primase-like protien